MQSCVALEVHDSSSARYIDHHDNFVASVRLNRTPLPISPHLRNDLMLDPVIATREFPAPASFYIRQFVNHNTMDIIHVDS